MLSRLRRRVGPDAGSVMLLLFFYTFVAAALIVVAIDVSQLFLARRALTSVADGAALAATQHVNRRVLYSAAGPGCDLPVDADEAERSVDAYVADAADGLRGTVTALSPPATTVRGATVTVRLDADLHVPFDTIVTVLLPGRSPLVHLAVVSHARSPLVGACP